jgi:hypothetical protein
MPIAAIVASSDDSPAEMSGSGTPVIGSKPTTAQMFTSACTRIQAVAPAAASRMKGSVIRRAIRSPAKAKPP